MGRRVFVLSDLHLGPGGPMTSFHEDARLCRLLENWATPEETARIDELVLAGDVFDFLQAPGYDGFDPTRAATHFAAILGNPATANVMGALRTLAARPGLDLTVLSGNHDPELLLDDVRAMFEKAIGREKHVRWADDDEPLVPRNGARLPVWGRAVHVPGAEKDLRRQAWIVHGDRWDPQNVFDRDAAKQSVRDRTRFRLPLGSHLVFEVLSKVIHSEQRRWVSELKPELPVVVPLLLAYAPRETMGYLKKHLGLPPRMLVNQLKAWAKRGSTLGEVPGAEPDPQDIAQQLTMDIVSTIDAALCESPEREHLLGPLEAYLEEGYVPDTEGTLGLGDTLRRVLLAAWLRALRIGGRFDDWGGSDSIPGDASRVVPPELGALIAGHTHAPRIRADLQPRYFNSGTWMPVRTLERDVDSVIRLAEAPYRPVPSPGTFVSIEVGDGLPEVAVIEAPEVEAKR